MLVSSFAFAFEFQIVNVILLDVQIKFCICTGISQTNTHAKLDGNEVLRQTQSRRLKDTVAEYSTVQPVIYEPLVLRPT